MNNFKLIKIADLTSRLLPQTHTTLQDNSVIQTQALVPAPTQIAHFTATLLDKQMDYYGYVWNNIFYVNNIVRVGVDVTRIVRPTEQLEVALTPAALLGAMLMKQMDMGAESFIDTSSFGFSPAYAVDSGDVVNLSSTIHSAFVAYEHACQVESNTNNRLNVARKLARGPEPMRLCQPFISNPELTFDLTKHPDLKPERPNEKFDPTEVGIALECITYPSIVDRDTLTRIVDCYLEPMLDRMPKPLY